jgi:phage gp45-like
MTLMQQLEQWIRPLKTRVRLMITRAVVEAVRDDKAGQLVDLADLATLVEVFQTYGFTSRAKAGSEAVVVHLNGNPDNPLILAVGDRRYRIKGLADGEVAIYSDEDDGGAAKHRVHLKAGRKIEVHGSTVSVKADSVLLGDDALAKKLATEDFVNVVYASHVHATAAPGPPVPPTPIPCPTATTSKTKGA